MSSVVPSIHGDPGRFGRPGFTQSFDTKNVGTGKTLTPTGVVVDGNSGANYAVTFVDASTGVITARPITVTAGTDTKTYDGSTSSSVVPSITAGTLAGSDVAAFTQTFDSAAVATGKTLNPAGSVLDGNAGANYAVTFVTDTTGVITQRQITVTADTQTKTYGNDDPALTYQVSGVVAPGDGFTGSLTQAPGEDVGTYAITQGTLALTSDYDLVFVPAQLTVTQRPITVTAGPLRRPTTRRRFPRWCRRSRPAPWRSSTLRALRSRSTRRTWGRARP